MITENLSTLKIHRLTQAQYERELSAGRLDENALYLTPDEVTAQTNEATSVTVTVADKTEYRFPNATNVAITCPTDVAQYECWIKIGGNRASFSISGAKRLGGNVTYDSYYVKGYEISIKDGYYTVGVCYS